jgi:hypothetical protein
VRKANKRWTRLRAVTEEERQRREEAAAREQSEAATRERQRLEQDEMERLKRTAEEARHRRPRNEARGKRATEQDHSRSWERRDDRLRTAHSEMTTGMAVEILGIGVGATEQEVRVAYERLIKRVHPDLGGSAFFTKQLNIARDTLLNEGFVASPMRARRPPASKPRSALSTVKIRIIVLTVLFLVAFVCAAVIVLLSAS